MAVKDGLYLVYVKDGQMYPIGQTEDEWAMLQLLGNTIAGNPVQLLSNSMGPAVNLSRVKQNSNVD